MNDRDRTHRANPQRVGPSPQVLKAIKREMKLKGLTPSDRRMRSVARGLGAEPTKVAGLNEGIFYPEEELPRLASRSLRGAALTPARAVRSRPTTGALRLLVLLVDFPDLPGKRPAKDFQAMLFSRGGYATGSMHDFYRENSYGKLALDGEVVGWLRLPNPYPYYVGKDNGCSDDFPHNSQGMVQDALAAAMKTMDFSRFDADGDRYLDGLFVVHAGGGAEAEPDAAKRAKEMWSHQWNLPRAVTSGGVSAFAYLTVPEDCRVGVCCHEFGHMLGLPDLYDTTYESEGVGAWCVMAGGSWNGGGDTPGHLCAWSKTRMGWVKPRNVKSARSLELAPVEDHQVVYRLWSKGQVGSEYFLIENRQRVKFDRDLPAGGLLIYRINDAAHNNDHAGDYWVTVEQADGARDLELMRNEGDAGDPWPGSARKIAFDASSVPPAIDRLGRPTRVAVRRIHMVGDKVACQVRV
jgi:immune inhibitor A